MAEAEGGGGPRAVELRSAPALLSKRRVTGLSLWKLVVRSPLQVRWWRAIAFLVACDESLRNEHWDRSAAAPFSRLPASLLPWALLGDRDQQSK